MNKAKLQTCYEGSLLHVFHNPFNYSYLLFITTQFQVQLYDLLTMTILARSDKPIWSYSDPPLKFIIKNRQNKAANEKKNKHSTKKQIESQNQRGQKQSYFNKGSNFVSQEKSANNREELQKKGRGRSTKRDQYEKDIEFNREKKIAQDLNQSDKSFTNWRRSAKDDEKLGRGQSTDRQKNYNKLLNQYQDDLKEQKAFDFNQDVQVSCSLQSYKKAPIHGEQQNEVKAEEIQQSIQDPKYHSGTHSEMLQGSAKLSGSRKGKEHHQRNPGELNTTYADKGKQSKILRSDSKQSETFRNQYRNENYNKDKDCERNNIRDYDQGGLSKDLQYSQYIPINQSKEKEKVQLCRQNNVLSNIEQKQQNENQLNNIRNRSNLRPIIQNNQGEQDLRSINQHNSVRHNQQGLDAQRKLRKINNSSQYQKSGLQDEHKQIHHKSTIRMEEQIQGEFQRGQAKRDLQRMEVQSQQEQQFQKQQRCTQTSIVVENYQFEDWSCIFSYDLNCFYIFGKGYIIACRIKAGVVQFDRYMFPSPTCLLQELQIFRTSQSLNQKAAKVNIKLEAISLFDKTFIVGFIKNKIFTLRQLDVQRQSDAKKIKRQIEKNGKARCNQNMNVRCFDNNKLIGCYDTDMCATQNALKSKKNRNKRRGDRLQQFQHNFAIIGQTIESMGVKMPASNSMIGFRGKKNIDDRQQELVKPNEKSAQYKLLNIGVELAQCKQITLLRGQSNQRDKFWICLTQTNELIVYELRKPKIHEIIEESLHEEEMLHVQQLGRINLQHMYSTSYRRICSQLADEYQQRSQKFPQMHSRQFSLSKEQAATVNDMSRLRISLNNRTRRLMKTSDTVYVIIYNSQVSELYAVQIDRLRNNMNIERPDLDIQGIKYRNIQKQAQGSIIQYCCRLTPNNREKDERFPNATCEVERHFLSMCFFQLGIDSSTKCIYKDDLYLVSVQKTMKQKQKESIKTTKNLIQQKPNAKKGRPVKNKQKESKQQMSEAVGQCNSNQKQRSQNKQCQLFIYRLFKQKLILLHKIDLDQTPESDIWSSPSVANHIFYIVNQSNVQSRVPFADNIRFNLTHFRQDSIKGDFRQQLQISNKKNGQEIVQHGNSSRNSNENESDSDSAPVKKIRMINILRSCSQNTVFHDDTQFDSSKVIAEQKLDVLVSKDIGQQWVCLGFRFEALDKNDIYQERQDEFDEINNEEDSTYEQHSGDDIIKMLNHFDDPFIDQQASLTGINAIDCRATPRRI